MFTTISLVASLIIVILVFVGSRVEKEIKKIKDEDMRHLAEVMQGLCYSTSLFLALLMLNLGSILLKIQAALEALPH